MAMPITQGMVYPASPYLPDCQRLTVKKVVEDNMIAKGLAIIIGNQHSTVYGALLGPIQDLICMTDAFRDLGYAVLPMLNASRQEILDIIRDVKQYFPCSPQTVNKLCYERFVFVFAGHGDDTDSIHTHDGAVSLNDEVIWPLLPVEAEHLRDIPKLFFIDACRAPIPDKPVPRGGGSRTPDTANYLLVHSTQPRQEAVETRSGGDWMQILAKEICKPTNVEKSINDILTEVNDLLIEQSNKLGRKGMQQPIASTTLNKVVKFLDEAKKLKGMYSQSCFPPSIPQFLHASPNHQAHSYPSQEQFRHISHWQQVPVGYTPFHQQDLLALNNCYPLASSNIPVNPYHPMVQTVPASHNLKSDSVRGGLPVEETQTSTSSIVSKSTPSSIKQLEKLLTEMHGPSPNIDYSLKETRRGFKATVIAPLIGYVDGEECSTEVKAKRSAAAKAIEKLKSV